MLTPNPPWPGLSPAISGLTVREVEQCRLLDFASSQFADNSPTAQYDGAISQRFDLVGVGRCEQDADPGLFGETGQQDIEIVAGPYINSLRWFIEHQETDGTARREPTPDCDLLLVAA